MGAKVRHGNGNGNRNPFRIVSKYVQIWINMDKLTIVREKETGTVRDCQPMMYREADLKAT